MTVLTGPTGGTRLQDGDGFVKVSPDFPRVLPMLTIYVALLWLIPSNQTIGALGSLGAPATTWGILCLAYWMWARVRSLGEGHRTLQPVRIAFLSFSLVILLSFSFAQARGLPPDESSPSITALITTASWAGVLLLANDGLTSRGQIVSLARRVSLFGGLLAVLGLAQFATGEPFIDKIHIPGFATSSDTLTVMARSGFVRANATATHPLEYAAILSAVIPLSLALAINSMRGGPINSMRGGRISTGWAYARLCWVPTAAGIACLISVSRSAIIGFIVGLGVMLPALSRRARLTVLGTLLGGVVFVYLAVPGMLGTVSGLFLGGPDNSTLSRTNGLPIAAEVVGHHPVLGRGFGTFLPSYYIFDNEIIGLLIGIGVVGLLAFLSVVGAALVQSQRARRAAGDPSSALLAHSLTAGVAGITSLFVFFDAFGFGMAAGAFVLLVGMCGAIYNVVTSGTPNSNTRRDEMRVEGDWYKSVPGVRTVTLSGARGGATQTPLWRRRQLVLVAGSGALLTIGCWSLLLTTPAVYWTRSEILLTVGGVTDAEALWDTPEGRLVPFTAAVEQAVDMSDPATRVMAKQATLYGLGVREGVSVRLLHEGSQWVPLFNDPVLVIETVAGGQRAAVAANIEARVLIGSVVSQLQADQGVPAKQRIRPVPIFDEPAVVRVDASRRGEFMALVASTLAGTLVTAGGIVLLDRRRCPTVGRRRLRRGSGRRPVSPM